MTRHRSQLRTAVCVAAGATLVAGLFTAPAAAQPLPELGDHPWGDASLPAEERASLLIDAMSEEQKIDQIAMDLDEDNNEDISDENFTCEWYTTGRHLEGMQDFGIPSIRMINGPSGVGGGDCDEDPPATGLPSGIGVASSFDRDHAYAWGDMAGAEVRANAHAVFLAPGVNMGRIAHAGRNFEYFGEDPYLSGVMGVEQILAIQDNDVHANVKHYAFNEQETERRSMNTVVPPRAAHEIYLLPFEMAAKDGDVASMMCSFPRVHGVYACENPELLTDVARERWGWNGYFLSDRRATLSTIDSIDAGFDLEFPRSAYFSEERIRAALDGNLGATDHPYRDEVLPAEEGQITWDQIDAMLHRRFTQMFEHGLIDNPVTGFMAPDDREALLADHAERSQTIAEDSMVLMKNDNDTLPLDADELGSIAVLGARYFAQDAKFGPNSPNIFNTVNALEEHIVDPIEGLENVLDELDSDAEVTFFPIDGPNDYDEAIEAVEDFDVAIVMVGDLSVEGSDRNTAALPGPEDFGHSREEGIINFEQTELIRDVGAENDNTVVVLKNGGPVLTDWRHHVPAILEAWYPGQADGVAVANVLFGLVNPGGKLPMTFPITEREAAFQTESQFPGVPTDEFAPIEDDPEFGTGEGIVLESTYSEDLEVGYRWYEAHNMSSPFPFGFGLSYTTFEYSDIATSVSEGDNGQDVVDVSFTITNTGDRVGAEAPQVYLTLPDEAGQPSKRLVGFDKVELAPGSSTTVTVEIDHDASNHPLSYFVPTSGDEDEWQEEGAWADGEWATADGTYTVHVGGSSVDTPLEEEIQLGEDDPDEPGEPEPPQEPMRYGFFLTNGWGGGDADYAFMYGRHSDEVLIGDWNGDGRDSITVRRGKTYFVNNHPRGGPAESVFHYGHEDDTVLVGDWDGDGTDTLAVRRGFMYHVKNSLRGGEADHVIAYGREGDNIVVGDWDADGADTFAVRRGKEYHVKNSMSGGDADVVFFYGREGDVVLAGDWDGDGYDTFAVRRGFEYHVKNDLRGGPADRVMFYGRAHDEVYVGDWDGNGTDTIGVRRTPETEAAAAAAD